MTARRQIHGTGGPGSHTLWHAPEIPGDASVDVDWFIQTAQLAERGTFDLVFTVGSGLNVDLRPMAPATLDCRPRRDQHPARRGGSQPRWVLVQHGAGLRHRLRPTVPPTLKEV